MLGAHVAGQEATRLIAALLEDGFTKGQIATWLGYRHPRFARRLTRVTLRTTLRLRAIRRRVCG